MKKRLLILGLVILVAVAILVVTRRATDNTAAALSLSGTIEVTEANLGFKTAGRIREMSAQEGQKVKKGEKLAALDSAELEALVALYEAQVRETSARLAELVAGSRPQEIEQARAQLSQAEADVKKARADFQRAQMLYQNGAVSAEQMEAATRAFEVAQSQARKASEALSLVREGARKEDITAAEMRVQATRAQLRVAKERLDDSVLYAPFDGIILIKYSEAGETVGGGTPAYKLGDLANPWVKVYVKEDKLGHVKLGEKAEVKTDSFPRKLYEGKVSFISSEAEFTPKNVQTQEERVKLVFGVKVSVQNTNDELKPGMPADVRIKLR